jgi:pimeloyl-ACP methyl ester carboxylesterase
MRDLLTVLGVPRVTVVGHSFGGGVGGQFAYQYPEMVERIILVDAGGMGPDVSWMVRFLSLPGSSTALTVVASPPLRPIIAGGMNLLSRLGLPITHDLDEVAKVYRTLGDPASRRAAQSLVRHVVDWRGAFITMADRNYLLERVPVLIIWGEHDFVVPVAHARSAVTDPMREVVVIEGAGHFPFRDEPEVFVELIDKFVTAHAPATFVRSRWRRALRTGPVSVA